ncbi:AbrB family transcriptional regulator, partial [Mesorhizobium sp. M8A.F.Ca.ET.023.01.1.1]
MDSAAEQPPPDQPAVERMTRLGKPWQWLILLVISALFAGALELAALPAALLIGPMLAAIVAGTNGATVRVPRLLFGSAQAIVGCLVAASISADIFPVFYKEWPLFLGAVIATVAASSLLGWLISRWRILPGTTAVWGSSPGAATAMVLMAGAFGADQRLVAFMQ